MTASSPLSSTLMNQIRSIGVLRRLVLAGRRVRTAAIDHYLRIHTPYPNKRLFDLGTHFNDAVPNEPVDYLLLRRFMKHVHLRSSDVVFDVGCGMGRALCMFARRSVQACVGIEFDPTLADMARRNAHRLRGRRTPVEVRCGDAIEADYSGGTVYWMFNPFGSKTMRIVLDRIEQSVCEAPRSIQIAYVNPVHEHEFNVCRWLRCTGREQSVFYGCYGASFWRNRAGWNGNKDAFEVGDVSEGSQLQNSAG